MSAKLYPRQSFVSPGQPREPGQQGIVQVLFTNEKETSPVVYQSEDRVEITEQPKQNTEDLEKRFPGLAGFGGD